MRKIYTTQFVFAMAGSMALAQTNFMPKRTLQKSDYASGITPNRYEANPLIIPAQRTPVLVEDFEGLNYPDLPTGWSTNEVVDDNGEMTPAFISGDAELANNGGFFPVPIILGNNFTNN